MTGKEINSLFISIDKKQQHWLNIIMSKSVSLDKAKDIYQSVNLKILNKINNKSLLKCQILIDNKVNEKLYYTYIKNATYESLRVRSKTIKILLDVDVNLLNIQDDTQDNDMADATNRICINNYCSDIDVLIKNTIQGVSIKQISKEIGIAASSASRKKRFGINKILKLYEETQKRVSS